MGSQASGAVFAAALAASGAPGSSLALYAGAAVAMFWVALSSARLIAGGGMAHVKLRSTADVDQALFTCWLRRAAELERQALPQRS